MMDRVVIAAPRSGTGKTWITCAFLEALKKRGRRPCSFKCGPDYIDPMFHRRVLGVPGANLDSYFLSPAGVRELYRDTMRREGADYAVIEGVMGYYDGLSGTSDRASTWEIAGILEAPVFLVVDARGSSLSLAAEVQGFLRFRSGSRIRGVILNRCRAAMAAVLRDVIPRECGIPVVGFLPEDPDFVLENRHLGLTSPEEVPDLAARIGKAADLMAESFDWDLIAGITLGNAPADGAAPEAPGTTERVRIGIARDEAFSFYYQENLRLLESLGADPVPVSPVRDPALPEGIAGLILGGGYPELHAGALSGNASMRESVRSALADGMPCLAECGGFLYLHETLEGTDGRDYPMAGVIGARGYRTDRLGRFGYAEFRTRDGMRIRGHEFHYWESTSPGDDWLAEKPSGRTWNAVHDSGRGQVAGFPHLYYLSEPAFARRWLDYCRLYAEGRL